MLKRTLMMVSFGLALGVAGAFAQVTTAADQEFFNQHIGDLVTLRPTSIDNPVLSRIFMARFFSVEVVVNGGSEKETVARQGSGLVQVSTPSTTASMPSFLKLFKPDFRLKSEDDAHGLQDALDVLYPISTDFGSDDVNAKTFKHSGNQWTFIRGKFFDHFKGFVITTDGTGFVTNVQYSLDIK